MKGFFAHRIWVIAPPYLWMLVFFVLPFGYILKISLAESVIAMPPYSDIWSWTEGQFSWLGSLDNYRFLLEDDLYYLAYFNSVRLAAIATLLCLFVAYPCWSNFMRFSLILGFVIKKLIFRNDFC